MTKPGREEELVFHYSRERRLRNASEAVRELNRTGPRTRPSLFRTLTANRSLAFLFLAVIMLSATALVANFLLPASDEAEYRGCRFALTAFRFEDSTYLALRKTSRGSGAYLGPAELRARFQGEETFSLSTTILVGAPAKEEFKYRLGGTGDRVEILLVVDGRTLALKTGVR